MKGGWFSVLALVTLGACAGDIWRLGGKDPFLDDCATVGFGHDPHEMIGVSGLHTVDILVVMDNSLSMGEEQSSLVDEFPRLIESLLDPADTDGDTLPDHVPVMDLHVGVVSTDMGSGGYSLCPDPWDGDNGELRHTPSSDVSGCDAAYPTYLAHESEEPDPDRIAWLSTGFQCIATLGTEGCGWEQPLKAASAALITHRDGANAGFLRPDSILAILFLTDEEDCSVAPGNEGIFDTTDASLGHLDLRCFHHPYMIDPVEKYITDFQSLRLGPEKLVLAFFVGVPPGDPCEGPGHAIPTCLEHPDMVEQVDPVDMTRLMPACGSSRGEAPPARRFVSIAQQFGDSALVHSVCREDYRPAIESIAARLHQTVDEFAIVLDLTAANDPSDPCRCVVDSRIIESLSDLRPCEEEGKPCWEPSGPGTGCAEPEEDADGHLRTLCEILQAGTRMMPCDPAAPADCDDPGVTHEIDGEGWYYMGRNWTDTSGTFFFEPEIKFTVGMEPATGSNVYLTYVDCYGPPTGTRGRGGRVGSPCEPAVCPDPGICDWGMGAVYFAESPDCSGGACLVFHLDQHICSRRCGPGAGIRGCPDGFLCYAPLLSAYPDTGCWCVNEERLALMPGHPDMGAVEVCR